MVEPQKTTQELSTGAASGGVPQVSRALCAAITTTVIAVFAYAGRSVNPGSQHLGCLLMTSRLSWRTWRQRIFNRPCRARTIPWEWGTSRHGGWRWPLIMEGILRKTLAPPREKRATSLSLAPEQNEQYRTLLYARAERSRSVSAHSGAGDV